MNNREYAYDNLKFVLIVFMVLGHALDLCIKSSKPFKSIFWFIYLFHIPAFVFVSGLFSKKSIANVRALRNNVIYYLLLYVLCKLYLSTVWHLIYGGWGFRLWSENGVPWYMFSMATWFVVTYLINVLKINKKIVFALSIALSCIVGYFADINDFLCLSRSIIFYPFFLAGYWMDPGKLLDSVKKSNVHRVMGILGFLLLAYVALFHIKELYEYRALFVARHPFSKLSNPEIGVFARLIWYVAAGAMIYCLIAVIPNRKLPVSYIGQRTLQIYFLHYLVFFMFTNRGVPELMKTHLPHYVWQFVYMGTSVIIVMVFSAKLFEYPFRLLQKIRKL